MANRHKAQCKASGGRTVYSGAGSNVAKEAVEKKLGGSVYSGAGSNVVKEAKSDANYRGGGNVEGSKAKTRIKKARGGGTSSTSSPMSSAGGGGASTHPFSSAHRG